MATLDAAENTLDVTIAVLGSEALPLLVALGEKFGLPAGIVTADPSVPLGLPASGNGPKVSFHLSAYESDRSRCDAVITAGVFDHDDVPAGREVVPFAGGDAMATVKSASRAALERMREREVLAMPHGVREGLHRHDRSASPALAPSGSPRVGHQVKIQINLREDEGWLAMGGTVHTVLGEDSVEADVVSTTDGAPDAFDGTWRARLERLPGWEFPWVMTSLSRLP